MSERTSGEARGERARNERNGTEQEVGESVARWWVGLVSCGVVVKATSLNLFGGRRTFTWARFLPGFCSETKDAGDGSLEKENYWKITSISRMCECSLNFREIQFIWDL